MRKHESTFYKGALFFIYEKTMNEVFLYVTFRSISCMVVSMFRNDQYISMDIVISQILIIFHKMANMIVVTFHGAYRLLVCYGWIHNVLDVKNIFCLSAKILKKIDQPYFN